MAKTQEEMMREHQEQMLKLQAEMLQKQNEMIASMYGNDPAAAAALQEQVRIATQAQMSQIEAVKNMAMVAMNAGTDPESQKAAYEQMQQWMGATEEDSASSTPEEGFESAMGYIQSVFTEFEEKAPLPYEEGEEARKFGCLLSAVPNTINGHEVEGFALSDDPEEAKETASMILSQYWGIESREDLFERLRDLVEEGGMSAEYAAYQEAEFAEELMDEDADDEDEAAARSRFALAKYLSDKVHPEKMRGWDLGRAAAVARWGFAVGFVDEDELGQILERCAVEAADLFDGWRDFAASYLTGGLFWSIAQGEDGAAEYLESAGSAVAELLDKDDEGAWLKHPWRKA